MATNVLSALSKPKTRNHLISGAFGTVRLLEDRETGMVYACKAVDKPSLGHTSAYEQLQREVAVMKAVYHPSIIQLREVYETKKKVFLVME